MTQAFLDSMSWAMAEVYASVTDQILINLAHHFPYLKSFEPLRGSYEYQARMLGQIGQVREETIRIILNHLGDADGHLKSVLEGTILEALKNEEPKLQRAARLGLIGQAGRPVVTPNQLQAFQMYYKQASDKLNLVNTVMLESTEQAYTGLVSDLTNKLSQTQSILNTETGKVITGVSAYNSAMREGVKRMVANGLTGFVDHGGHHWSPEAYVAMDIRTTLFNTGRAAVWERNQEYGNDLYQVSVKAAARPLCYPWQGKVLSSSGRTGRTTDLDGNEVIIHSEAEVESFRYGGGLFGVNCGHYPIVFIPGVSTIEQPPQDEEENKKAYAESQEQRALERKLRAEKRDLEVLKAQGAPEEEIKAQRQRVRQASGELQDFCDETGRARQRSREYTPVDAKWPDIDAGGGGGTGGGPAGNPPGGNNPPPQSVYGRPFNSNGDPQLAGYSRSAEQALANGPEATRKVWEKVSDRLQEPSFNATEGTAYYDRRDGKTHYKNYAAAYDESSYQRKNTVFFHEYGHNIDNLLSDRASSYYSCAYKDNLFGKTLQRECEQRVREFYMESGGYSSVYDAIKDMQNRPGGMTMPSYVRQALRSVMPHDEWRAIRSMVLDAGDDDTVLKPLFDKYLGELGESDLRAAMHMPSVGAGFCEYMKEAYTIYERSDVSGMFQRYTEEHWGIARPFGIGHDRGYFVGDSIQTTEAFAEMYSATVLQSESLDCIKELFPESYKVFLQMLEDALL